MAEPFLAEIRIMSFNFAPQFWAMCNGQLLPINQNQALFALLGTTYGGNGQTTFALPNLRGQVPIHMGGGHTLGEKAGTTSVTLNQQQMPAHNHFFNAVTTTGNSNVNSPSGFFGVSQTPIYAGQQNLLTISPTSVSNVGGSQPHENMMPYLVLNFCIALQ